MFNISFHVFAGVVINNDTHTVESLCFIADVLNYYSSFGPITYLGYPFNCADIGEWVYAAAQKSKRIFHYDKDAIVNKIETVLIPELVSDSINCATFFIQTSCMDMYTDCLSVFDVSDLRMQGYQDVEVSGCLEDV